MGKEELRLVQEVLESGKVGDGEQCRQFEHEAGQLLGSQYVLATPNGTMAITLALLALGVGQGDEVIVPDLTWIATANAISPTGAKIVLADVDPTTLTIDPTAIRKVVSSKTKAIIPVHVSGRAANMTEIMAIGEEHNIPIIEDAAEAFMSKYKDKYLGTIGELGIFSLSINKIITSGQGGLVVTNNKELANRMLEIKNQGISKNDSFWSKVGGKLGLLATGNDVINSVGYNYKWSNINAAVALGQFKDLKKRMERIKSTLATYRHNLPKQITLLPFDLNSGELPLWIDCVAENRDKLYNYLSERKIFCRKFWLPLHNQKPYMGNDRDFPNSTRLYDKALWLPSAFTFEDNDIMHICDVIKSFYS